MTSATAEYRVASVVLNYNSDADLQVSVPQLCAQQGIHHAVIIVDNASTPECVQRTQDWLREEYPDAIIGTVAEVEAWVQANPRLAQENGRVYLMLNHENRGYSAGNNIGIRLAETLKASSVLIANPDMRIQVKCYLKYLVETLFSCERNCIAASRIIDLNGKDQSPLKEQSFLQELFWPMQLIKIFSSTKSDVIPCLQMQPQSVDKIAGCCFLLKSRFIKEAEYFDENVFLYCEEGIISEKVKSVDGRIIFVPALSAIHAHDASSKAASNVRIKEFVKSRLYYSSKYKKYGYFKIVGLYLSYKALILMHVARDKAAELKGNFLDN